MPPTMTRANEPAYPCEGPNCPAYGLTIREHFALEAMCASLSGTPGGHLSPPQLYREAIEHADGLLAALAQEQRK